MRVRVRIYTILASAITVICLSGACALAVAATPTARFDVEPLRSPRTCGFPILGGGAKEYMPPGDAGSGLPHDLDDETARMARPAYR
jgi:hypothetical protein